jgi:predicted RNA-binding protein with PUA-like domain
MEEERVKPYVPAVDYWLLGTDPREYSYGDLERDTETVWDGVTDYLALKYLRDIDAGDEVLICHTGEEPMAVGIARVISDTYPDPRQDDPQFVAFDLEPVRALESPVPLSELLTDPDFEDLELEDLMELAVAPLSPALWNRVLEHAKANATVTEEP